MNSYLKEPIKINLGCNLPRKPERLLRSPATHPCLPWPNGKLPILQFQWEKLKLSDSYLSGQSYCWSRNNWWQNAKHTRNPCPFHQAFLACLTLALDPWPFSLAQTQGLGSKHVCQQAHTATSVANSGRTQLSLICTLLPNALQLHWDEKWIGSTSCH